MKFYQYILISVILFKILLATSDDLEVNNKISCNFKLNLIINFKSYKIFFT